MTVLLKNLNPSHTPLVLIRHGPTDWNAQGRMQGRSDQPLSREGEKTVADWQLPEELNFDLWLSSPLKRARQTAALLGRDEVVVEPHLNEMSWGDWEGLVLSDLRRQQSEMMAVAEAKGLDFAPPGGESPRQVQQRLMPFLNDIGAAKNPAVAVTHKGVIRALYALASGWPMLGKPPVKLQNACAHVFSVGHHGDIAVLQLNISL